MLKHGQVASELAVSSDGFSLAIHMVIVPFLGYEALENATLERMEDYKLCLRKNLAHPQVERVHILTTNSADTLARFKEFASNSKVLISEVRSVDKFRDCWDYISQNLIGRDVIYANADIYLGGGFDKVDAVVMDRQRIMYTLSRQVAPEHEVTCGKTSKEYFFENLCSKYRGSHDAFLFRLHQPLPEAFLQTFDFDLPSPGMEGRVNWSFANVLQYCVLNPCSILEVFHYHCSDLRVGFYRLRLRKGEHIRVPPSDSLYCLNTTHAVRTLPHDIPRSL